MLGLKKILCLLCIIFLTCSLEAAWGNRSRCARVDGGIFFRTPRPDRFHEFCDSCDYWYDRRCYRYCPHTNHPVGIFPGFGFGISSNGPSFGFGFGL